jgi:hypothetical protein
MAKNPHRDPKGAEQPKSQPNLLEQEEQETEEGLDKTIEDSFPASDPPSSIPDPHEDKENAA